MRKIRAAEEGPLIRGTQEHGQRPAARIGRDHLLRRLVDLVEVGPLLAVDLDVHEQAVHHSRGRGVLEGLVRHDVAPVAGRIADRQQDGLVLPLRQRERLLAPRIPIDRIIRVLQEIRAGFRREAIALHP